MAMRNAAISHVMRALSTVNASALCDRELLERYAFEHDQAAFAAIVHRHRSMVEGVCRRTLANPHDAEDACQAVFLLLARKADTVRWQASASNWLYLTARKVAHNARVASERRARRERRAALPEAVSPADTLSGRELLMILDEELERLAPRYREALVLCCLEGLARDEAASRLGIPEATLASQLARGRKKLGDALSARGFSLGAALLAAAATCTAEGSSPRLVDAVLNALSGSPSASVAVRIQEIAMNGVLTNMKFAVLATVGVVVLGLGFAANQLTSGQPQRAELKAAMDKSDKPNDAAKAQAGADAKPETAKWQSAVEVSGRVLDPDGKPVAGVKLFIPHAKKNPMRPPLMDEWDPIDWELVASSAADGYFNFSYKNPRALLPGCVIAYADGFGVDWLVVPSDKPVADNILLKLVKDQPIRGRILDTEGKPVSGVSVSAVAIFVPEDFKLDNYLAAWKTNWRKTQLRDAGHTPVKDVQHPLDTVIGKTSTDKNGQFILRGAGAERIVHLAVRGGGIAGLEAQVLTRAGLDPKPVNEAALAQEPGEFRSVGNVPSLYGPESTFVVEAERIVEGVVKDLSTGKPLSGIRINFSGRSGGFKVTETDSNGKYRLAGLSQAKTYSVHAFERQGGPYLPRTAEAEAMPGASSPVRIDIEMVKGVAVSGRVIDRQTGKGVAGSVRFAPAFDNKHFGMPGFEGFKNTLNAWSTESDGTFRLFTIPGKSLLMVHVDGEEKLKISPYLPARPDSDYKEMFGYNKGNDTWLFQSARSVEFLNLQSSVKVVDLKPAGGEVHVELFVDRGRTAKLSVQDADGKPLPGAIVSGLAAQWPIADEIKEATATVYAIDPERPRRLALLHLKRNLGGTVTVRGDEKEPVVVKLKALGAMTGRLLQMDGTPLTGAVVSINSRDQIASELYHSTANRTVPPVKTDNEGRFTLPALIPGIKFDFHAHQGETYYVLDPKFEPAEVNPGQTLDIGELKLKPQD